MARDEQYDEEAFAYGSDPRGDSEIWGPDNPIYAEQVAQEQERAWAERLARDPECQPPLLSLDDVPY